MSHEGCVIVEPMMDSRQRGFCLPGRLQQAGIQFALSSFLSILLLWSAEVFADPASPSKGAAPPVQDAAKPAPYRWALGLSNSEGGFWAKEIGWVRQDVQLRVWAGLRLCRVVELQAGFDESLERFLMGFRFSGRYLPWGQGPYAKLDLALRFSAAGPQVGLGTGLGFSWAFHIPIGLFIEAEVLGWLNEPRALSISAVGGLFVTFGN